MERKKTEGHTYLYNGVTYSNMKEACEGIGIKSKLFRILVKNKLIIKSKE
ncbi:hypothetical protein SAMN04487911_10939 [Arenibacter nanhaiticus]|uniref:Uncharacterized protein n=1 Tax=Arenibacter nanhaiticus TaxID=558155 RepID=A0A1M6FPS6_9FLAO|nr:hypothetical protein SAMN04487911_10939 [Arenibacter nanhaiticus]